MTNAVLDRYFRRFGNQEHRDQKIIEISSNPVVDEICRRYEQWSEKLDSYVTEGLYRLSIKLTRDIEITESDIREFSLRMGKYQNDKDFYAIGIFLSGIINSSNSKKFEIITDFIDVPIECLGYKNRKDIKIVGNVGTSIGLNMKRGSILVQGDARHHVGGSMEGGSIIVQGDAGFFVGSSMYDGTINLEGDVGFVSSNWKGGRIYNRGILVRGVEQ